MIDTLSTQKPLTKWSPIKKCSFRFFFILFVLFICFNNNGAFPFFEVIMNYPTELMHKLIPWIATNVLNYKYDHTIFTNGSGDTSYDYIMLGSMGFVALVGAAIWSVIDYKRNSYNRLYYWLLVLVRCYLALTLMSYGMFKVIKLQFPDPSLYRLTQAYGDSSPMGLAWTFLGFSKGYNLFMGIIEVSAILLLFRRTMVVGAFLALAASAHVMSMNYFYDVPVKILSTTLVVLCLFILAPYLKRILAFMLTKQSVSLQIIEAPSYKKKWLYYGIYGLKYVFVIGFTAMLFTNCLESSKQYGSQAPKAPLYGLYKTERFLLNNTELPPLTTDSVRWSELTIQWAGSARVKKMTDSMKYANFKVDTIKKQVKFYFGKDSTKKSILQYQMIDKDHLSLAGLINKDSVNITLKKVDLKKFRLINREFHWINEWPYNR